MYFAINRLVVDTQTQFSGILLFDNQEQDIEIWIRPQPSDIKNDVIPFAIINNKNGQNLLKFYYFQNNTEVALIIEYQQGFAIKIGNFQVVDRFNLIWIQFRVKKSAEIIENIIQGNQVIPIQDMKLKNLNMIYSWQSKQFSCIIYDQFESLNYFKEKYSTLSREIFIKCLFLINFNFRFNTILLIYLKFQKTQELQKFVHILDQNFSIVIYLNLTSIIIDFNYGYLKQFSNAFNSNMTNQWFQISLFSEIQSIKCQLVYNEKNNEYDVPFVYATQNEIVIDQILFLPKIIGVAQYVQNYKIFVINKFIDNQVVILDKFCFQNCKICNKLQCLECEGQLSLQDNCQCPVNQDVHPSLGICVDKTLTQNINVSHSFDIKFCPFGQNYDQKNHQCVECPKLYEFYCTTCLYNHEYWQSEKECYYQDIEQKTIAQSFQFQNTQPTRQSELLERDDEYTQRFIIFFRDIYIILYQVCEPNYFFDSQFKKCMIQPKGQQFGFIKQKLAICKIGYSNLNKCMKCQKNCLFCKFVNYKILCILPNQSYTLDQYQQIIKCQDSKCQEIYNQVYEECQIENCMICYFASCLVCNDKYINDFEGFCHIGSQYSAYLRLEVNDNLIKPQYDYQQIFYLRYQLKQFKIYLNNNDILQLMIFGNNYKSMRQQLENYSNDNQQVYCLNQTQFFGYKFCHQAAPGYQYIQQLEKYVYCYNNNCQFDLIYQVIILFSNQPSIQYKNMSFRNFEIFAQSLSINDLFINNIIIEARIYVFDTFQNDCDSSFFIISNKTMYNFQVILDFQGVSVFENCYNFLNIGFNEIQILNLFTYSQITIQFRCNKVLIKNCTFYNQENILFYVESSYIQLEQIFIQGILKKQNLAIIYFTHPQLIENVLIIDLYLGNVSLYQSGLIYIVSKINQAKIVSMRIKYNQFLEQSSVLRGNEAINLRIDFLIVDNTLFEKSGLVLLQEYNNTYLTINNLTIQESQIKSGSALLQSYLLNLVNVSFIKIQIENSFLIFVRQNLTMQNIIFFNMQFFQSQILCYQVNFISVYQFSIKDSLIVQSKSLIEIFSTTSFSFRFIWHNLL